MRWLLALLTAFLFLPLPALAQDAPELGQPQRVLEDPTGDYYASLKECADTCGIDDPGVYYDFMDMEWLDITEDEDSFTFTLKVLSLESKTNDPTTTDSGGFNDGGFFWIHFRHNDWDYQLQLERPSGNTEISFFAVLQSKFVDAEEWGFLFRDDEHVTWDLEANTVSYTVLREDLADGRGAAPYPGRSLEDWWVLAAQRSSRASSDFEGNEVGFPWDLYDRMPDEGVGDTSVDIQAGLEQTGHARLYSDEPYRASNGEATTFLYTVTAHNAGDTKDLFSLETVGVPSGWDVQLPLVAVELAGGEDIPLPVLVSTPFGHQHGGTADFILEMRSTTDDRAVGRVELGVRYLAIPQPAGHHDEVYVHSIPNAQTASFNSAFDAAFQPSGELWFNTWAEDESDQDTPVSAYGGLGDAEFIWLIPLDPTLRLGLDFDMESIGQTNFQISAPEPMQDVTISGAFRLRQAGDDGFRSILDAPALATFTDTGRTWDQPGADQSFGLDIVPQPEGDYVPYSASNELWLTIELSGTGVSTYNQNTVPTLDPGASFRLPLLEYEDDISDAYTALSGASLTADAATRDANPGDVVLFEVEAKAHSGADGTYDLDLIGPDGDMGEIVSDAQVALGGTLSPTTTILVQVPEGASDGDTIDFFLQATHSTDPQRRGLVRLVVHVDTDQEWDDDLEAATLAGYLGNEEQESPAPVGAAALTLLGAAWASRRRH